jgi:hypothetical protein
MKNIFILLIFVFIAGCSPSNAANQNENTETQPAFSTPTPTAISGGRNTPLSRVDKCEGLGGSLEMQALVGPSEEVGLEPLAVGSIPFSVVSNEGVNLLQGSGAISYQDVLEKEWGTYTVNFNLETAINGTCASDNESGMLDIIVSMSGEQFVEVVSQGFQGEYPWSGSHEFNLSLPIIEGASAEGEGWLFVLHLNE